MTDLKENTVKKVASTSYDKDQDNNNDDNNTDGQTQTVELVTQTLKAGGDDKDDEKLLDSQDKDDDNDNEHHSVVEKLEDTISELRNSKYTKGECICFFSFLIVFTTMAILGRGTGDVSFTQTVTIRNSLINKDEFIPWNDKGEKSFNDASTIEDIYRYLEDVAFPFLLNDEDDYYIQSQQALLGGLRIKQVKLKTKECPKKNFTRCWSTDWNKGTITYPYNGDPEGISFEYRDSSDISDQVWRGKYGSYPGGGFVVDIPLSYMGGLVILDTLRNISWIDGGTAAVFMDFNTYNPSTGLHTVARLAWEMPTSGVFPNDEIKTWKFERYTGSDGSALAVFHVLFLIYVIGLTIMTARDMYSVGCFSCGGKSYWNSKWKAIDVVNLIIFYITIVLFIVNEVYRTSDINLFNTSSFVSFRKLQGLFTLESYTKAVNGGLLWIKLFKYLAINKRLRFLFTMLGRSGIDILMFIIVLGVFVIAFGTAGFITFNSDVDDFRSYIFSMSNMIRFVLVEMDYESLTLSSRIWGSGFYFFWSLLMLLVLVNVFIAILTESYSQVQMELTPDDKLDLGFLGMGNAFKSIRNAVSAKINAAVKHDEFDGDGDGKVSAEELAQQTGVTVEKAKEIIAKHDTDGDGQLDAEEFDHLKKQIINEQVAVAQQEEIKSQLSISSPQSPHSNNTNNNNISSDEFNKLKNEIDDIMELLMTVLDQTAAGKRALKQRELEKQRENDDKNGKNNKNNKRRSSKFK